MKPTLILIDGKNALYRYGYAMKNLRTEDGHFTGALYGLLNALLRLEKKYEGARFVVVWDGHGYKQGWRAKLYPKYKANRVAAVDGGSQELKAVHQQEHAAKDILRSIGIAQSALDSVEADDIIGILANAYAREYQVVIYSSDMDFLQLMPLGVTVLRDAGPKRMQPETENTVLERYRVSPGKILKLRAICGDKSDAIEGLFGVGPVGASKALSAGCDPAKKDCSKGLAWVGSEKWNVVHRNYRIMRIIPQVGDDELPLQDRAVLTKEMVRLESILRGKVQPPGRDRSTMLSLFSLYELQEAVENRHTLWGLGEYQ